MNELPLTVESDLACNRGSWRRRGVRVLLSTACVLILLCAGGSWWWSSQPNFGEVVRSGGGQFHSESNLGGLFVGRTPHVYTYIRFRDGDIDEWLHAHHAELARQQWLALTLRESDVTGDGLSALSGLESLVFLELRGTPLEDADVAHVVSLPGVNQLDVARTGISGSALAGLSQMPQLACLCIDSSQATPEGIAGLAACPSLQWVTLFDANDASVRQVSGLNGLIWLDLVGEDLTADCLTTLPEMQSLQQLRLFDSTFSPEELRSLRQALPGCDIQQMPYASAPFVQAREEMWNE